MPIDLPSFVIVKLTYTYLKTENKRNTSILVLLYNYHIKFLLWINTHGDNIRHEDTST